ncbi:MAG: thioredoxin domain-containing protein [Candidatus Parcubacteria bacterium]|nr:thioredoxin domain-containing protein [Candidatus Parcubacteria bacterium]
MPNPDQKISYKSPKFYFVYFIIFSIIILLIFSFKIVGYYWDYWSIIRNMDKYYKGRQTELVQVYPQINQGDPVKGAPDAKVIIYEYSDFFCSACKDRQADLTALEKYFGNKISFVFKGLPLDHPESNNAMLAAYCAADQNKFWEYKDLLFNNQALLNEQMYRELATQLGLNLDQFNQCYSQKKYQPIITNNLADALGLQINSTPTLYINRQKIEGFFDFTSIKGTVEQGLR